MNTDAGLKTVFKPKSETQKAEHEVRKFSGNCVFPNASLKEDENGSDEQ